MEQYVFTGDTIPFQTGGNVCFCPVMHYPPRGTNYHYVGSSCVGEGDEEVGWLTDLNSGQQISYN